MANMQRLHPKAVWLFFWTNAIGFIFLGIAALLASTFNLTFLETEKFPMTEGGVILATVLIIGSYLWAKLHYASYKYDLKEDVFQKEYGILAKRYVTIPYEKIQNVDIHRGLLARMLGLSNLQIQTAGASYAGAEGTLPGITHKVAEQLRDEILKRAQTRKNTQGSNI
ncbi:MAG: PH domain-containing protein [Candidatus Kaiserbacteria bacterium]|nr:PH domain-containing protein [Candidatus Kaiserbacteria bacterium]